MCFGGVGVCWGLLLVMLEVVCRLGLCGGGGWVKDEKLLFGASLFPNVWED
jgi:hypothetical protein